MKSLYLALAIVAVIALPAAMAGEGGIQVSAVTVDCGDAQKENDVLQSAGSARIWMNVPAGTNTDGVTYTISDQTNPIVNTTSFSVTACGDGYFYGDITLPNAEGSVTLTVARSDGTTFGSDTFQLRRS